MWAKPHVISKSLAQIVLCAWLMASRFSNCWVIIFNCFRRKIKYIPHVPYLNIKPRLVHDKFQRVHLTVQAEVFRPLFSHLCCCLLVKPNWFNYYSFNNLPWELRMFLTVWEPLRCLFLRTDFWVNTHHRSKIGGAAVMVDLRELLPICTHLISRAQPEGCFSLLVGQRAALGGALLDVPILPLSSGASSDLKLWQGDSSLSNWTNQKWTPNQCSL